jgi:hypothetical protein
MSFSTTNTASETDRECWHFLEKSQPIWLTPDGVVNINLDAVLNMDEVAQKRRYALINWCVAKQVPCVLRSEETSCKAAGL